jgi:acyl-CoA dehydrogenase
MIRDQSTLNVILETVENLVNKRLIPIENECSEKDEIPESVVEEIRSLGLFGLSIPEEYGGLGLTAEEEIMVVFELCRAAPIFRSVIATNVGIGGLSVLLDGTEEQKQKYLPGIASGAIRISFALTEPEAGSDAASIRTSAVRDGDAFILNGTKRFITNAPEADLFTVFARSKPEEKGAAGVTAFLVEKGTPGLALGANEKKMGQWGGHVCDVIFNNCRVPASAIVGQEEGIGFKTAMKAFDKTRTHIAALCVAAAERILEEALNYSLERKQFNKRICDFQLVQAMLADSKTEILAARSMVLETARKYDLKKNITMDSSCCKLFASEMVGRVADRAVQILGGNGYIRDYAVERFYRDVRLFRIFEGTSQIQQLIIARGMIKEVAG